MGRAKDSLKHQLRTTAFSGLTDNDSLRAYRRAIDAFTAWAKSEGIKDITQIDVNIIQAYTDYLQSRPEEYTPATIHAKLAPICKATGVSMKEIRKPKRTAGKIIRGRAETKTGRAEKELTDAKYSRLVTLQRCVGIRRAELAKLTGADLITDRGQVYIRVRGGKGGKDTLQYVLPKDRETVMQIFQGIKPEERVFSDAELSNHINLHKIRSQHARECYEFYADVLSRNPKSADKLRAVLLKRWTEGHQQLLRTDSRTYNRARERFVKDMDSRPFILRGENREKALKLGRPTTYSRLALMAVSVLHLSHWRLDVTSVNYLVQ